MAQSNTKVLVATRLTKAERSALARLAATNDRPMSREIRRAILQHLRREQDPHPLQGAGVAQVQEDHP